MGWFGWYAGGSKLIGIRRDAFVEIPASGSGEVRELRRIGLDSIAATISSDGKQVLALTNRGIVATRIDGTPEEIRPRVVAENSGEDRVDRPAFSPDGRWVVYSISGPGDGLYVQPFPGPGRRRQIASGAARRPVWRLGMVRRSLYSSAGVH